MSIPGRLKSYVGGSGEVNANITLASAATVNVPDDHNLFYVSGTTTITSLLAGPRTYNRSVMFVGAAGSTVVFTNTNTPTAAGQMYLHGANRTIQEDDIIELVCKQDGVWILRNITV